MDREDFWHLIETSRKGAEDCEEQAEKLAKLLMVLEPEEIVEFAGQMQARLAEAYRWDLWAVAYIINGGCSDDGFEYFCGWLIAQGKQYFEEALAYPAAAARKVVPGDFVECESILYAAIEAYEQKTGKSDMPVRDVERPKDPVGEKWEEADLEKLFPKLVRRFG